jgi:cystine transport system substrate-binding protein
VIAGLVAAAGGAETPSALLRQADALRHANASLSGRSHAALLGLYSLDSQLARAQARLDALRAEASRIERERSLVRSQLGVAHQVLRMSQRQLAFRLRALYEQPAADALAIVLGAQSLDEAITSLDDLSRAAQQNRRVAAESSKARVSLTRLSRRLSARDAQVHALERDAERTTAALRSARVAREQYIRGLSSQRRLNVSQIAQLDTRAQAAVAMNPAVTASTPAVISPTPAAPTPGGGRTITVSATGYALGGTTATGIPVGWGVVAVDPSVIPLGTRMSIPGYGSGVAADTGSAVQGATIDLWFPTTAQALAWGRRTVTITLY